MNSRSCESSGMLLGALRDGQLDAVRTLEVEEHLDSCEVCRERSALGEAIRGSLQKAVRVSAPEDVRTRLVAALAGQAAREEAALQQSAESSGGRVTMLRTWRTMLPVAGAAALLLAWGFAGEQPVVHGPSDVLRAGFGNDDLLRDLVAAHSRLPPESQDPKQVRSVERYVGVPVHMPQLPKDARFVGWRLVPVHGGDSAAMLQYELKQGQRVTLFVYNPRTIQIGGSNLALRAVGSSEVRVGQTDGYSVAVMQHGGVGYTIASDLDPEQSARLVSVVDNE